ncbi:DUF4257 domain-containing protein [Priestia koreensis]|uniref:DUF4257 domain-containing protein n=1 Tax=Priestia koreensis TaxID=284581 RepID=A0A0M0KPJ9_9BACI|nr:DUF4257 domain-containing protein [Priestia koreensis]KOO40318.1 hypothetical protein AMD01_21450 [Priestia koreensis]UNL87549.1 DUF4257 domain-containing protein [Priestia koreensis]
MLQTIIYAAIIGGITGFVSHIMRNNKSIIFPRRKKNPKSFFLGFLADILAGSTAAVFAVTYLVPETTSLRTLMGISILAGLSAETVLLNRQLSLEQLKADSKEKLDDRNQQIRRR